MDYNKDLILWPDLSGYGIVLGSLKLPSGEERLVLIDESGRFEKIAPRIGFVKTRWDGVYSRNGGKINASQLMAVFPRVKTVRLSRDEIRRSVARRIIRKTEESEAGLSMDAAMKQSRFLGLNHIGQEVFEGEGGRFIRNLDAGGNVLLEKDDTPALFLRAPDDQSLRLCAEGLIHEIMAGRILRSDNLTRFLNAVYPDRGLLTDGHDQPEVLNKVNAAIESAIINRLAKEASIPDRHAFGVALRLHEGQPVRFQSDGELMTPAPIGVVMQKLLGEGASATDAIIYDNSEQQNHAFLLQNGKIVGKKEVFGSLSRLDVRADLPRFALVGAFAKKTPREVEVSGLRTYRADHLAVVEALRARADDGRAVFAITAEKAGKAEGSFRRLIDWVGRRYKIDAIVDIDSNLIGVASKSATRLIVIDKKLAAENNEWGTRYATTIPVISDYESLWSWSDHVLDREIEEGVEHIAGKHEENLYQAPYIPASVISDPTTMVPRNLVAPTRRALTRVEDIRGTVDEFVSRELQWSLDEMQQYLAAEQVDAVALALDANMRGRGFIEADQTGMGKGRVLAALARHARLNGKPVVFITEKSNLIQDFYRDIEDIGSLNLFRNPLILNSDATAFDSNGEKIAKPSNKATVETVVDSGEYPRQYDIIMGTYTQFNRDITKPSPINDQGRRDPLLDPLAIRRARWLPKACEGALVLLDESHNAAGMESNIGDLFNQCVQNACDVVYSSATFARGARNMGIYKRVFPNTVDTNELPQVLSKGGEPLQEIMSSMLAEDGCMIRREHDLSEIDFIMEEADAYLERNTELSDRLAEIMAAMCYVSGEVNEIVGALRDEVKQHLLQANSQAKAQGNAVGKASMGYTYTHFGSKLFNLTRTFMMSMTADYAADKAIQALNEGRKPVIVFENTMESILKRAVEEVIDPALVDDNGNEIEVDSIEGVEDGGYLDRAIADAKEAEDRDVKEMLVNRKITFRDVLYMAANKLFDVKEFKVDKGKYKVKTKQIKVDPSLQEAYASMIKMIDEMPDVYASPLDVIKEKIEAAGYSIGEISGRGLSLKVDGERSLLSPAAVGIRNQVISKFNNGAIDSLLLSRAGAAGISLHASEKFLDQRRREMIEFQASMDVLQRVQFFGRVNRRGQVCPPVIRMISTGLPGQNRLMMLQNQRLREMSANITSNRENSGLNETIPDFLNKLGNEVCYRFLENNPKVGQVLDIDMVDLESDFYKAHPTFFADKLTARIVMLPVLEQNRAYMEIISEFKALVRELEAKGENPLRAHEFDIKATIVSRDIFEPALPGAESVFSAPIYQTKIEWQEKVHPIKSSEVLREIVSGVKDLSDKINHLTYLHNNPRMSFWRQKSFDLEKSIDFPPFDHAKPLVGLRQILDQRRLSLLNNVTSKKYPSVVEAMASSEENPVKNLANRLNFLSDVMTRLAPGSWVKGIKTWDGEFDAVVVGITPPIAGGEHLLGGYDLKLRVPGKSRMFYCTLNEAYNQNYEILRPRVGEDFFVFDDAEPGSHQREKTVLDGNMFRAVQMAVDQGSGLSSVFTDNQGLRQRCVAFPSGVTPQNQFMVKLDNAEMVNEFWIRYGSQKTAIHSKAYKKMGEVDWSLRMQHHRIVLSIPGNKKTMDMVASDASLTSLIGKPRGSRIEKLAVISSTDVKALLDILMKAPYSLKFFANPRYRAEIHSLREEMTEKSQATKAFSNC